MFHRSSRCITLLFPPPFLPPLLQADEPADPRPEHVDPSFVRAARRRLRHFRRRRAQVCPQEAT